MIRWAAGTAAADEVVARQFAGAFVEITSDPLVIDIRQKLPWITSLEKKPAGEHIIYLPNKLGIGRYMFIGDAS